MFGYAELFLRISIDSYLWPQLKTSICSSSSSSGTYMRVVKKKKGTYMREVTKPSILNLNHINLCIVWIIKIIF